jgi:diketogulonate reductase-like aldo/keto reductase
MAAYKSYVSVVGATKISPVEGAASAVDLKLTDDDIKALEEFYEPHFLSGVNGTEHTAARTTEQVWIKNGKYAK